MENEVINTTEVEVEKTNVFQKSINWVKDHKKTLVKGTVVAAVVAAGVLLLKGSSKTEDEVIDTDSTDPDFNPELDSETTEN
nr:MAG TPA: Protein of unknown function (DUF2659) [Caudoviricetes sp.]